MDTLKEMAIVFVWIALSLLLVQVFISVGNRSSKRNRKFDNSLDQNPSNLREKVEAK